MKIKIASLVLCLAMMMLVFSACGSGNQAATSGDEENTTEQQASTVSDTAKTDTASTQADSSVKKKIVVVQDMDDEVRNGTEASIMAALEKGGYVNGKNAEITEMKLGGDEKKGPDVVTKIKEMKPDVVITNGGVFAPQAIAKPLAGSGIPVIMNVNVENKIVDAVDADGKPKQNITGIYNMPKDLQFNAFDLLNKIAPISGKKAVFISIPGKFTKEGVEGNLKKLNIELKDYVEVKFTEEYQEVAKKYNADPEVGWVLTGVWPSAKKDGTSVSNIDMVTWDVQNIKKANVTYWEVAVKAGTLAGLGVDLSETGAQAAELAIKVLQGEKVENMNAIYPRKIVVVLNQQRAKELNVQFPPDVLGSAYRIYTDYKGNFNK